MTSEDFSKRPYDIISQNTVNCVSNTPFFVNLQLKPNMNYRGPTPKTDTIRKILILKVKNSSIHYTYPIEVYVYESTNASSISWWNMYECMRFISYLMSLLIIIIFQISKIYTFWKFIFINTLSVLIRLYNLCKH